VTELRLVPGGFRIGRVPVRFASAVPPEAEVLLVEEDTWLVLSADPAVREPGEAPMKTFTGAFAGEAREPGDIVPRGGSPARWLAVVVDLDASPAGRPAWVEAAVKRALAEASSSGLGCVALPLLGTASGALSPEQSAAGIASGLSACASDDVEVVVLTEDEGARSLLASSSAPGDVR
jgi:hypothetical protein